MTSTATYNITASSGVNLCKIFPVYPSKREIIKISALVITE